MPNQLQPERRKQPQILSLHVLAGMDAPVRPEQSQFAILVHHFLDRFFNNEMASSDDEGRTRLIQVACATGLPGWVAAMYLWPVYHDLFGLHRPYWAQVGDHYFFCPVQPPNQESNAFSSEDRDCLHFRGRFSAERKSSLNHRSAGRH
jgi:hypothetical protein